MMTDDRLAGIDERLTKLFEEGYEHEEMSGLAEHALPEMFDEIKRLRAQLAVFKEGVPSLHDFNHADIQIGGGGEAMRVHQWLCRIIASIAAMKEGE